MSNRKNYVLKLQKVERLRKKRLAKKLKREKKLFGRKKELLTKGGLSGEGSDIGSRAAQLRGTNR